MTFAGVASNAEALRTGPDANEACRGVLADPAIFVAEHALELVPAFQQPRGVACKTKIDDVRSIAGIQFGAIGGRQQVIDAALVRRGVGASNTVERVVAITMERPVAVWTAKTDLKLRFVELYRRRLAGFAANRC